MNRKLVIAGLVILLATSFYPMLSRTAGAASITLTGDQVISDSQAFSGDTITITNGNLTIASGGSITARGVTFIMDSTVTGRYHIEVATGGSLAASGCTIKSTSNAYRFQFWIRTDATVQMDNCVLNDCGYLTLNPGSTSGLYIQSNTTQVTNSTISNNCGGVLIDSAATPFIYKNTISSNDWYGVCAIGDSAPVVDNNIVNGNMKNCGGVNYGAGMVSNGASPVFSNNTITANNDVASQGLSIGILLYTSGAPQLLYNKISGHINPTTTNWAWGVYNFGPTGTYMKGCTITDNGCGLYARSGRLGMDDCVISKSAHAGDSSGGYSLADFTSSQINNTEFSGGRWGALELDSTGTVFDHCTIANNTQGGLVGDGFNAAFGPTLTNCTLSGNGKDIKFTASEGGGSGGIATIINTVYDNKSVEITDNNAQLIIKWIVHVKVTQESTGAIVTGASVKCRDRLGGTQLLILSGADGWSPYMILQEKTIGNKSESNVTLAPYNISVAKGSAFNWTILPLDRSYEFTFPLDDLAPWMKVDSPQDNDVVNRTSVEFTGTVETPFVAVSVGGVAAAVNPDGTWSAKVPLNAEGKNVITASAQDRGRNFFNQTVTVIRDTTAPVITLTSPEDNSLTNKTMVTVAGRVNDITGRTLVNGAEVPVAPDGTFSTQVPIDEGINTVKVESSDAVWNTATLTVHVERDSSAPALIVSEPGDGFATNASSVTLKGNTDSDAVLTVNGKPVPVSGERFSTTVSLEEGDNFIDVAAMDPAGNVRLVEIRVVRDSIAPKLTLTFPEDGAIVKDPLVTVKGSTEEGALVKVNGGGVSFDGRNFMAEVRLTTEGENTIVIDAFDALKNHVQLVLKVYLDTTAPDLKITSPANNFLTGAAQFELRGRTEALANVTIDGEPVTVDQSGLFTSKIQLPTDGTYTFDIISTDLAGNFNEEFLTVIKDTVAHYNISSPVEGLKTKQKTLSVTGDVEVGSTVSVNGNSVSVRPDGTFIAEVILSDGPNTIIVQVRDKAGNLATKELTVTKTKAATPSSGGIPGFEALLAVAALAAVAVAWQVRRHN
jgi:parallel beta-helix repeat protein